MKHSRRCFTREMLMDRGGGYAYARDDRTVDVRNRRLRWGLERDPEQQKYIMS